MKRILEIFDAVRVQEHDDGTRDVVVRVDRALLAPLTLEISLLVESLADELALLQNGEILVNLSMAKQSDRGGSTRRGPRLEIRLLKRDFEFLGSFLLKYYRDGEAEVDHIDIDLHDPDMGTEQGMFIVQAADAADGMTDHEAKRILGIL